MASSTTENRRRKGKKQTVAAPTTFTKTKMSNSISLNFLSILRLGEILITMDSWSLLTMVATNDKKVIGRYYKNKYISEHSV